ncbi:MAG: hypothetical protein M1118_00890 [Chloroflexi bacterium]|nr:hypothetical protein [Chloroflexota bacterium]
MIAEASELPGHEWLSEPELAFHPERVEDRSIHPLRGLVEFGPYSRSLVNTVLDPIRVGMIVPHGEARRMNALLDELEQRHHPRERMDYLPEFLGFSRIMGLRAVGVPQARVELPPTLDDEIGGSLHPHVLLAERITRALSTLQALRSDFDVLLIYLPDRWQDCFYGPAEEDFDLHDYLKAVTASRGIPTQIVREDKALAYPCRCSVMWRLAIALYCKAGGVPWKLAHADPDMAYVGLSYAVRPINTDRGRYVTCCSQVFDADGAGLEFIAYETDEVHIERDNPFLSRSEMRRVMVRSLSLYQRRHAGRAPKRVIIHKSTEFKPDEIDGCFDAWRSAEGLDLVHVQQDVIWRGVGIDQPVDRSGPRGNPAPYPILRGSYLPLGNRDVLLWTQGNVPAAAAGKNFYKEGKAIPAPLLLSRYAGHGGWNDSCRWMLGLTKMNWNNDGLYDRLPVTMEYAQVLARTIKRMPQVGPRPYEFRFFM